MPPPAPAATAEPVTVLPLLVQSGNRRWLLGDTAIAGRSPEATIQVPGADTRASPAHAVLAPGPGGWTVADLGSAAGTWLNGFRVHDPVPLAKGDRLRIGRTILIVVPVEPGPSA